MLLIINRWLRNILVRLVVYYSAVATAFAGMFRSFPEISVYMSSERLRGEGVSLNLDPEKILDIGEQHLRSEATSLLDPFTSVPVLVALLSVIALTIPVGWVYRWTRRADKYNPSITHALLVLPIAITLVVFLVKGSLALAFSLAGIVAAIRFRTALAESEDAVFMFIVIGIGLAAGVQLTNVAFIASVFFNLSALAMWGIDFGARPALLSGWSLVPEPVPNEADHPWPHDDTPKKRYNTLLQMPTSDVEATQKSVIPILDSVAKAWRISKVMDEEGIPVVEFEVRFKKSIDVARAVRDLEDATVATGRVRVKKG